VGLIGNVFVLPGHRDSGIGRRLLDAALAHARRCDFARVVLAPSARSVPFYARAGFRPATSLLILEPVDDTGGSGG
jgi:predicted N-acetyltransferase YhbS